MATQTSSGPKPTQEQIAQRAYEIYMAKGRPEGRDLDHWLEAERELSASGEGSQRPQQTSPGPIAQGARASRPGSGAARKSTRPPASRW